jgi:hypothetical protein
MTKKYKVTNYRYGLPVGSIVQEDKIDNDRIRFLAPVVEKVSKAKETNEVKNE